MNGPKDICSLWFKSDVFLGLRVGKRFICSKSLANFSQNRSEPCDFCPLSFFILQNLVHTYYTTCVLCQHSVVNPLYSESHCQLSIYVVFFCESCCDLDRYRSGQESFPMPLIYFKYFLNYPNSHFIQKIKSQPPACPAHNPLN